MSSSLATNLRETVRARSQFQLVIPLLALISTIAIGQVTTRVNLDSAGDEANGYTAGCSVSADGRFVAFPSVAGNLVANDTNGTTDTFVHDRKTGETVRVSVDSQGHEGDSWSGLPSISADGRLVAFISAATNLVPDAGWGNGHTQVFVHDRATQRTWQLSVASFEQSFEKGGNADSLYPFISANGQGVAFMSAASNLVPGDTNGTFDVFFHDLNTGLTRRASVDSSGDQGNSSSSGPSLSADGRYVCFDSHASNLVPGDTNGSTDVFVHDCETGTTLRVNVASDGSQANDESYRSSISADGRLVAFGSDATNLVSDDTNPWMDIFVHDLQTQETTRASLNSKGRQANSYSFDPQLSADGRFVTFVSDASNLSGGDTNGYNDIFVRDRLEGKTRRASVDSDGNQANNWSWLPEISADGRFKAFSSVASNLAANDNNGEMDVFVRGPQHTLEAEPAEVTGGEQLTLTTYKGVPDNGASLFIVAVNGTSTFQFVSLGDFAADGLYIVSGIVPGIGPVEITFRGYALGRNGEINPTNDLLVVFK